MANILKRFGDIMAANINALLEKAEDPEKLIDKYLRDIEEDLGKVKAETAAVMAAETKAKRELDECAEEAAKMQKYAEKALLAGNDGDARQFLEKKMQLTEKQNGLKEAYDLAAANAAKMKELHEQGVPYKEMAVFVDGTAPGDEIEAHIIKVKSSYAVGIIRKII